MSDLYEEKIPTTNDKYVGIEIECFTRRPEFINTYFESEPSPKVEQTFKKYGLQNYVEISDDGSIEAPTIDIDNEDYDEDDPFDSTTRTIDAATMELKVLAKQSELGMVLEKLGKALKEIGAEVNESCGLHVHLDMRNRPVLDCIKKLLNVQGIMLKSVPRHRRNNTYCLPVSKKYEKNLTEIGKYHVINTTTLEDLKTIEVRVHEGTVDVKEIHKWCSFLIKTIDGDFATKNIRTAKRLPVRLKNYIESRMAASR